MDGVVIGHVVIQVAECFIASKVNVTGSGVNFGGHVYTLAQRTYMIERNLFDMK